MAVKTVEPTKQKCPSCGKNLAFCNFYQSNSSLYKGNNGLMIFCKECIIEKYEANFKITNEEQSAVKLTCMKFDIPFDDKNFENAMGQVAKSDGKSHPFRIYMQKINSLGFVNGGVGLEFEAINLIALNDGSKIKKENMSIDERMTEIENMVKLTAEDLQTKEDVIRLVGYDLFAGYSEFDQKFLYNELITYLDEDLLDDSFKLSQVIQLVNNNQQIRKFDLVINLMSSNTKDLVENQGSIKTYISTKNQIVASTDKIAKENSISVKNRGDKRAGKSTLTYMMANLRELGFANAEADYYDQLTSHAMLEVENISNRSILEQLGLDENDYTDMINTQRDMIQLMQARLDEIEEENRQLHEKLGE